MNKLIKNACTILTLYALQAGAGNVDQAVIKTQADIEHATKQLNQLRIKIDLERQPLTERQRKLSQAVAKKRQKADKARETQRSSSEEIRQLDTEVARLDNEYQLIQSSLQEYRRKLDSALTAAAHSAYRSQLQASDTHKQTADQILALGTRIIRAGIGGSQTTATVLDKSGIENMGQLLLLGPLAYFAASNTAGIVTGSPDSILPTCHPPRSEAQCTAIMRLIAGATAEVPVDLTNGKALRVEQTKTSISKQVRKGGAVMLPLLLLGCSAILITLWKLADMRRTSTKADLAPIISAIKAGNIEGAHSQAKELPPLAAKLIGEAINYRAAPREHIEEIMHEHILAMMPGLEKHLGTLAVMGGIAPLLGLLGTVTGMMHTFQLVTIFGTGDARLLSGGISEALITTKFGLAIAIPILLAHALFARRIRTTVANLENMAIQFINAIKENQ